MQTSKKTVLLSLVKTDKMFKYRLTEEVPLGPALLCSYSRDPILPLMNINSSILLLLLIHHYDISYNLLLKC